MSFGDEVRRGVANQKRLESESFVVFALGILSGFVALVSRVAVGTVLAGHSVIEARHLFAVASGSLLIFGDACHSFVDGVGGFFVVDFVGEGIVFGVDFIPCGAGFVGPKVDGGIFRLSGLALLERLALLFDFGGELCGFRSFFVECWHCFG